MRNMKNKEAISSWMAKKLMEPLRTNPDMKSAGILAELKKYGVKPSQAQLYRARRRACDDLEGDHGGSYAKLPAYAEMVMRTNPTSLVKLRFEIQSISRAPSFKRLLISCAALKRGLQRRYMPFLGFDGCHFKGPYGGVLLWSLLFQGLHQDS